VATNKSKEQKEKLTSELTRNRRTPVWIYLKTKDRSMLRRRRRHWRAGKLKLKTPHKKAEIRKLTTTKRARAKRTKKGD
jgi:ribosomal protein L39E